MAAACWQLTARNSERGFAGLLLAVLFILLFALPMIYFQSVRIEEQHARDVAIKKVLEFISSFVTARSGLETGTHGLAVCFCRVFRDILGFLGTVKNHYESIGYAVLVVPSGPDR